MSVSKRNIEFRCFECDMEEKLLFAVLDSLKRLRLVQPFSAPGGPGLVGPVFCGGGGGGERKPFLTIVFSTVRPLPSY